MALITTKEKEYSCLILHFLHEKVFLHFYKLLVAGTDILDKKSALAHQFSHKT